MEREVRYCTTDDGIRIAYCVAGEGPAHVVMPEPTASHVQLEWSHPVLGPFFASLSEHNTLVRFDPRGTGLSDRVLPSTPAEWVRDLETVVRRLELDEFALSAIEAGCRAAIAFAAGHPGQVRRLVLIDGFAHMRDLLATPQMRALVASVANDWEMATEASATVVYGSGHADGRTLGAFLRACADREFYMQGPSRNLDVSNLMDQLTVPTLVLRHKASRMYTAEMSRDLAASIRDARLIEVDGLWADDVEGFAARIVAFVCDPERSTTGRVEAQSGVRTVLFTDLVGHTEMMQRLGDKKGRDVLREHERITRATLKQHGGAEVKTMGDGFMASFGSVTSAVDCAMALQRAFAAHTESMPEPLHVRVGLNAGEPIEEDGDLFGSTVILASRIAAKAGAGEILIPEPLRHLLSGKSYIYADRGQTMLKGFEDAVRLYEVRWQD
jgi:class 3 adenylate cyclase